MTEEEFQCYRLYSNEFRGQELAAAKQVSHAKGVQLANMELDDCLPQGLKTENNTLLCLEVKLNGITYVIGYFWYFLAETSAFIYDFQVFPEYQGKGYGSRIFQELNEFWTGSGIEQVELLVAYDNERAFKLYKEIGFKATGINMVMQTKN
ncbi:GNAT family N-acetyltransferase [Vibrio anguillarum]|uniref:GNAT family N-acetyltransferase n=13 Tax=Vibrio anguillarum TaxID=55601 RepID=A0ABR9ZDV8_VIBAN|nr:MULTISPECIES: GNAT family N-acetyltransferase [Vibrio]ASG01750.1 GNAT family N-acetyltransferase [Vibrio anguillarum]MBF4217910.1 GNAT family N-acetyltransferase [Vibrio anguillarum]MBF4242340.1 GNAT family N-acetyltransferase [Vibrio anguillarum]MBF4254627.1 GNAT family N-acetyltransferase [Vibrio anguillarum]MBF4258338.1 GNAT family N-acetyltransferase [Vibrio anguillarum]